jgi:hypothetical protein
MQGCMPSLPHLDVCGFPAVMTLRPVVPKMRPALKLAHGLHLVRQGGNPLSALQCCLDLAAELHASMESKVSGLDMLGASTAGIVIIT